MVENRKASKLVRAVQQMVLGLIVTADTCGMNGLKKIWVWLKAEGSLQCREGTDHTLVRSRQVAESLRKGRPCTLTPRGLCKSHGMCGLSLKCFLKNNLCVLFK